jgi:hypothetical protein
MKIFLAHIINRLPIRTNARIGFIASVYFIIIIFSACSKKNTPGPLPNPIDTTTVNPQVDPTLALTIGFFMDDWEPKNFTIPSTFISAPLPTGVISTVTIDRSNVITKIPRSIAGNNANIWMTQMVTEPSLIDHLTTLHPHIIRFPGGSLSDVFFWNSPVNTPACKCTCKPCTSKW